MIITQSAWNNFGHQSNYSSDGVFKILHKVHCVDFNYYQVFMNVCIKEIF